MNFHLAEEIFFDFEKKSENFENYIRMSWSETLTKKIIYDMNFKKSLIILLEEPVYVAEDLLLGITMIAFLHMLVVGSPV